MLNILWGLFFTSVGAGMSALYNGDKGAIAWLTIATFCFAFCIVALEAYQRSRDGKHD